MKNHWILLGLSGDCEENYCLACDASSSVEIGRRFGGSYRHKQRSFSGPCRAVGITSPIFTSRARDACADYSSPAAETYTELGSTAPWGLSALALPRSLWRCAPPSAIFADYRPDIGQLHQAHRRIKNLLTVK
jgi:hypothetical protein